MTGVEHQTLHKAPRCLIPFDRREGISIEEAAEISGKSAQTMR
ncbi:hypothetical protein OCOJLMKI_1726 [Methylobacterium iners]|uniref:Uncharacterized protein n=1 Tax=Methylobacterium iners TaxID=418707 RepID=A0ABQ4RUN1_9HYPH|nr:hypothetical protein OCOJLMKI_1726 [Methylobacterium iners]